MRQIGKLMNYILPYKGRVFLIVLFNLLYAICSVASLTLIAPFLQLLFGQIEPISKPDFVLSISVIIDYFFYYLGFLIETQGPNSALFYIAATMILLSLLSNFFRYLSMFFLGYIRANVVKDIRKLLYEKVLRLPFLTLYRYKKGDLINRLGSDVQEIEWSVFSSMQSMFRDPLLIIVFMIVLCKISVLLTLLAFLFVPLAGYLITKLGKTIERNSKKSQTLLAQMSSLFDETVGSLKVIKGYSAIDYAEEQFKIQSEKHNRVNRKIFTINEMIAPLTEFLSIVTILLVLFFGGKVLSEGGLALSANIFIMYIVIFARILPPIKQFVTTYYALQKGAPSAQRVFEIIELEEDYEDDTDDKLPISDFQEIEFKEVSFYYNEGYWVLKNVNLKIKKGEKIAIVGASGSGKSTLVDLLPRFYDVKEGEILIDGVPVQNYKLSDLRALFAWVSQDVVLFHNSVYHNVTMGRDNFSDDAVATALKEARADVFVHEMKDGWHTQVGDRGSNLSGGERQRISIARALLQQASCLVLDEPTSALDKESSEMVKQTIEKISEEKTTITITHQFNQIERADVIYFIENGVIIERGKHEELLAQKGRYFQYFEKQG